MAWSATPGVQTVSRQRGRRHVPCCPRSPGAITVAGVVVANATTSAWDQRDGETAIAYRAFVEFRGRNVPERALYVRERSQRRIWAKRFDWQARVAAWDDNRDDVMRRALTDAIVEMRRRHANVGHELLARVVVYFDDLTDWRPADLIKLAEFARRLEVAGLVGTDRDLSSTATAAKSSAPLGDEWDRLAADLSTSGTG